MKDKFEDFKPCLRKRSSDIVISIWDIVQPYIITCMGMSNYVKLYYNIDSDEIIISIENENKDKIIPMKEFNNPINDIVYKNAFITYDIFMTIINSNSNFYMSIDDCNYYHFPEDYDLDEIEDGFIFLEANISSSLTNIHKIRHEFVKLLSRETQYAINNSVEKITDETIDIAELDSKIEQVIGLSKIYNITFKKSYELYSKELNLDLNEKYYLEKLIKKDCFSEKQL